MAVVSVPRALIPSDLIARRELASRLSVSPRTVDHWMYNGVCGLKLPHVQVGDRAFFSAAAWHQWSEDVSRRKADQYGKPKRQRAKTVKTSAKAKKVLARFGL